MPGPQGTNRGFNLIKRKNRAYVSPAIVKKTWTNPVAASTNAFLTTVAGPNTATNTYVATQQSQFLGTAFTGARANGLVDFARNVVITVTDATAVVAMSGVITGLDIHGNLITEAWSVTATGTSKTFTGAKAFSRVLRVTVTAATNAASNSVVIGTGVVFGLEATCSVATRIIETSAGSVVTNGTIVAGSTSASADAIGTYSPNAAPNGATTYSLYYISDNPETT